MSLLTQCFVFELRNGKPLRSEMPPAQIESTMAEFYRLYATSSAGAVAEEKKTLRHKITGRIRH